MKMINTYDIKLKQKEIFRVGNPNSKEVILIMGSCRSVPYLNYLNRWNVQNGNRFLIYFIDPFNYHWDDKENRVDYVAEITKLETNENLLNILSSVKIFIHEYYKNFGMFNTLKDGDKNIYEYGMKPEMDITIPNFNDLFILVNDIVAFSPDIKKQISEGVFPYDEVYEISQKNIEKFYSVCRMSDIPEMENYFRENFQKVRFYWTSNHISKHFSLGIFRFLNEKFLKLSLTDAYWSEISEEDLFANNYTFLTDYDMQFYNYQWGEEIKQIKL